MENEDKNKGRQGNLDVSKVISNLSFPSVVLILIQATTNLSVDMDMHSECSLRPFPQTATSICLKHKSDHLRVSLAYSLKFRLFALDHHTL